ncbi:2-succinyl-5-enolpyruvyl-6-hydroxy-3-cyclohexene-1-carboxylic-acid synthase [Flavobacteriaceae bacterium]|nr:2-succinyl-5-enolpyruvyl-6-hydroxy-3-cyclohexene-1-carboxylic-acid synthase [Flavobacteriaceae bacterium]
MQYSSIPLAQTVVLHCKAQGISRIVISPGSRNAPLTISFLADPFFDCYSIVDERAAGFFALGLAQRNQEPTVLVCTSGSALLNYYPAVSEAYYSGIPLVVISADRPSYLIDKGYGQTIKQEGVFGKHVVFSSPLIQDASHAVERYNRFMPKDLQYNQEVISQKNHTLLATAFSQLKATNRPIHLNTPFEEPLYQEAPLYESALAPPATEASVSHSDSEAVHKTLSDPELKALWEGANRIMVIVGVLYPNATDYLSNELVEWLSKDPRVLVFTETTSNVHHPEFIDSIDNIIAPMESHLDAPAIGAALSPDLLVTIGGAVVSKKIKNFLNQHTPKLHWQIQNEIVVNPFFTHFTCFRPTADAFFSPAFQKPISLEMPPLDTPKKRALGYKSSYKAHIENYTASCPFSDFYAFYHLLNALPNNTVLHLANSATIRYAQLFSVKSSVSVYCNRGTSGIDGSTATAIGASVASQVQTILVTGDLGFFYDSNGLWNKYIPKDFKIILINNQGGGIFRVLPGKTDSDNFRTYFETVHELSAQALCNLHGFEYNSAQDKDSLANELASFFLRNNGPSLLEIKTPRTENEGVLMNFFNTLKAYY